MLSVNSTEIQDFLRRAKNSTSHPWLHPLNPALSQVDEPLIWTLTGHPSGVNCVAIAPDGPTAVSGSCARWEKGTVLKIWNLDVGQEIASIERPFDGFKAVAITPNGRLAVTGCGDGTGRIWDLEQGVMPDNKGGYNWLYRQDFEDLGTQYLGSSSHSIRTQRQRSIGSCNPGG